MSCVWICLNLLCAATYFLQSSASSEGVWLDCCKPPEVVAGQSLTINCSVHYIDKIQNCTVTTVMLNRNNVTFLEDGPNNMWLNVSNVIKSSNWTVTVSTDCGLAKPYTIEVKVLDPPEQPKKLQKNPQKKQQPELVSKVPAKLGVCVLLTVAIPLLFLLGTGRGRKFLKHMMRKKFQGDYTPPDSSSPPDEC